MWRGWEGWVVRSWFGMGMRGWRFRSGCMIGVGFWHGAVATAP